MKVDLIFAGLQNTGDKYKGTRHNFGADVLRVFAENQGVSFKNNKFCGGQSTLFEYDGKVAAFFIPDSFMNVSGESIKKAVEFFEIEDLSSLVLLHDEINIPLGKIKITFGKSSGGHNGVESVVQSLKSKDFYRIRLGIGKNATPSDMQSFVLKKFSMLERGKLKSGYDLAEKAIMEFIKHGGNSAMNKFN